VFESDETRILILDDEAPIRLLLEETLAQAGYRCRQADCVEQAMALLGGGNFHLVLCDLRMPGMDGLDLIRHVQGMEDETGVVMVSAVQDIATAVETLREGAYDYIVKPFRADELLERVRGAVERVMLARENRNYAMHLRNEVERRTEDLRAIQDDLRRSEERRRLLLEQAGEAILILDGDTGEVLEANRRAEALFGYRRSEMEGLPLEALDRGGELADTLERLAGCGAKGGRTSIQMHRREGGAIEVSASAARIEGPEGPLVSLILRDASEEGPAWPRFLARLSHELRTPLTSVLGHCDIVEMLGNVLDEQQMSSLRCVRLNARQCIRLVENLLDHSRSETRHGEAREGEIHMEETVLDVAETLKPLAAEKGIDIRCRFRKEVPPLWGDGQAMRQVLLNLGANAIQYTHRGGIGIKVRYDSGTLDVRVVDTGIGIARDDRERVFREGERLAGGEIPGAGLGLSIARRLARRMGGEIRLWSRFGWGSVFTFRVPLPVAAGAAEGRPRMAKSA